MLKVPDAKLFPGTGASGNGMPVTLRDQGLWLRYIKTDGCNSCHQLGDKSTRELARAIGPFRQLGRGVGAAHPIGPAGRADGAGDRRSRSRAARLANFGDWTDRIEKGELPFAKPSRPAGVERNVVLTLWDWSQPTAYMHDLTSTDKRNPTLNVKGVIYGSPELSSDYVAWLDPANNKTGLIKTEWRDPKTPSTKTAPIYAPSPYWAKEPVWDSHSLNHNPMMDDKGRIWLTSRIRPDANPAFCKGRLASSFRRSVPDECLAPAIADVRSGDEEDHDARYLLFHPSSEFRQERHDLVFQRQQHRSGDRLVRHQEMGRDPRRTGEPGLGAVHRRHQCQRQGGRLCRARSAGRSEKGQARSAGALFGLGQSGGRHDLGGGAGLSPEPRPASIPRPS